MEHTTSQNKEIKKHLLSGKRLTALEALDLFGCLRLGSRIYDLREKGLPIEKEMIKVNGKRVAEYYIK